MSYSFRNRPKLSDRYRGKSGDEILNELKNQIDEDRKMFFESSPGWNSVQSPPGSFSRAGNPLDDMMSRGRQDIRSHLDDLAQRHPEFADHLRCPPWAGEMGAASRGTWGRKRRGSGSSGDENASIPESSLQEQQSSEEPSPSRGRSRPSNLPQYGLRNTVDLGQQQQQCEDQEKGRGQRSWSAPPDNRTQNPPDPPRFVSRLDIPINSMPSNSNPDQGKPPVAPKQQHNVQHQQSQHPQHPPQQKAENTKQNQHGSTVRHIPIFVEGRDEPLLPKTADTSSEKIFTEKVPSQTTFNYGRPSQFMSRPGPQQSAPHMPQQTSFSQNAASPKQKTFAHPQQQQQPQQPQQPSPQPPPFTPPQQPSSQPKQDSSDQPKPTPKQFSANDPISRVQAVQKDVDDLKVKVDHYQGNSRKDKDYMYLDEMLTRNLLKLDNIETEGRDDVRQARKSVIRNIQHCISVLESKVPSPDENSHKPSVNSDQGSTQPESDANGSNSCSLKQDSELKMEAECTQTNVQNQSNPNSDSTNVVSVVAMEMQPGLVDNANKDSAASNVESYEVAKSTVSEGSENDSFKPPGEDKDLGSENMKQAGNESGESNVKQAEMQVDENKIGPIQQGMEIDNSNSKETTADPVTNDGNQENLQIPKCDESASVSSKTSTKLKSPKGSPKKGKRAT